MNNTILIIYLVKEFIKCMMPIVLIILVRDFLSWLNLIKFIPIHYY